MNTIVETTQGQLQGRSENGLHVFRGVPFAAPPTADLRFRPPAPGPRWTGVREAFEYGNAAPQRLMPHLAHLPIAGGGISVPIDEDCLYLNVYTPGLDDARRPVMVWIHGGGFTMGTASSPASEPTALVRNGDAVIVTFNYRLGALGFLHLGELCGDVLASTPNVGLLDQAAALAWVRDNIAAFGGDPGNVTIFGESAGGMSVGALLGLPAARGLFHRAILESGAAHNVHDAGAATRVAEGVLRELGVEPSNARKLLEIPPEQIVEAQERYYDIFTWMTRPGPFAGPGRTPAYAVAYQPVVDGVVIPRHPLEAVRAGELADVSILVGHNLHDQKASELMDPEVPSDEAGLRRVLEDRVPGGDHARLLAAYLPRLDAVGGWPQLFSTVETDRVFALPSLRLAEAQSAVQAQTYKYVFTWESPIPLVGAGHGLEIPFVFGLLDQQGMDIFAGTGPEADALSTAMQQAWVSFARTGDPSTASLPWPTYDTADRVTMIFGRASAAEATPLPEHIRAWDGAL